MHMKAIWVAMNMLGDMQPFLVYPILHMRHTPPSLLITKYGVVRAWGKYAYEGLNLANQMSRKLVVFDRKLEGIHSTIVLLICYVL